MMRVAVRFAMTRDFPTVCQMDRELFPYEGGRTDGLHSHPERFRVLVAVHKRQVVGFLAWVPLGEVFSIWSMGVLPEYRRYGIGRRLLDELVAAMYTHNELLTMGERRVDTLVAIVSDTNLGAHLFFRAAGFRTEQGGIIRDPFESTGDAYRFVWRPRVRSGAWAGINRVAGLFKRAAKGRDAFRLGKVQA